MRYLKQKKSQILLALFIISSLVLTFAPSTDLYISSLFFDHTFYAKNSWWEQLLYQSVTPFLTLSIIAILVLWLRNRGKAPHQQWGHIDGAKVLFFLLVLIIGSGLIVNYVFKEHFGRPRPKDITQFQGSKTFSPAFYITGHPQGNKSFSSGHGSAAFAALPLALFFKRKKRALIIASAYGALVSLARIAAGGHFFSDVIVSFFIMAITTDIFYYHFFTRKKAQHNENQCAEL